MRVNAVKSLAHGELEIATLNEIYLKDELLDVQLLGRSIAWHDTGTMDSPVESDDFDQMISKRQEITISAPEGIAYNYSWINKEELLESAERYVKSPY